MRRSTASPDHLSGTLAPPGDKSISHRSTVLNAMSQGEAVVTNYSPGGDCAATLRCLRALGVPIRRLEAEGSFAIEGVGLDGFREPTDVLNAGNSGTTMRLLSGPASRTSLPFHHYRRQIPALPAHGPDHQAAKPDGRTHPGPGRRLQGTPGSYAAVTCMASSTPCRWPARSSNPA